MHIDLDQIGSIAHTGVRRAVLFMGLGLNAAHREDFNDYQLSKLPVLPGQTGPSIDFFPSDLPLERVREFKTQFAGWITGCGLRELLEHYALYLDQIHNIALQLFQLNGKLGTIDPVKAQAEFNGRYGVPKKLEVLADRFGVSTEHSGSVDSLYQARNCFTHDLGIVLPKRCVSADNIFEISWTTFVLKAKGADGSESTLIDLIGKPTEQEMTIGAGFELVRRRFSAFEHLMLSQQDLWEICFFFSNFAIPSVMASFRAFMATEGVKFIDVPTAQTDDNHSAAPEKS